MSWAARSGARAAWERVLDLQGRWLGTPSSASMRIRVLDGRHAGAEIDGQKLLVGSEIGADLFLSDVGVSAQHATLSLIDTPAGTRLLVTALAPVGTDRGGMAPGTARNFRLATEIRIGEAVLCIEGRKHVTEAPPAPEAKLEVPASRQLANGSLAVLGLVSMGLLFLPQLQQAYVGVPVPSRNSNRDADELRRSLRDAQLGAVRVTVATDGVVAEGTLPKERYQQWLALRAEFQQRRGGELLDMVTMSAMAGPPTRLVASVSISGHYVIRSDGEKRLVGQEFDDGWVISAIDSKSVTFARDGTEYVWSLRQSTEK